MAVVSGAQQAVLYNPSDTGTGERTVVIRIRNVTTGDTVDVSTYLAKVKAATFVVAGILATAGTVGVAGTTLTLTLATMANDTLYLTVIGESAN